MAGGASGKKNRFGDPVPESESFYNLSTLQN